MFCLSLLVAVASSISPSPRRFRLRAAAGVAVLASACGLFSCGDGAAPAERLPAWATGAQSGLPVWLFPENQGLASWQIDAPTQPGGAGVGAASDEVSDVPAGTGVVGSGGPAVSGGFYLLAGCDVRVDLEVAGRVSSSHICVDVFFNVNPQAYANAGPEQVCSEFAAAGAGSLLTYTALPNGCDRTLATGVCTSTQDLGMGYRARSDTYYYDDGYDSRAMQDGETCRRL
jgi:hypothetical protein